MLKDQIHNFMDADTESIEAQASQTGRRDSQNKKNQINKDTSQKPRKNSNHSAEADK